MIGLGYVGLPLAVTAVESGLSCVGFDVSDDIVARLRSGDSHVDDITGQRLEGALRAGLQVTTDEHDLHDADRAHDLRAQPARPQPA